MQLGRLTAIRPLRARTGVTTFLAGGFNQKELEPGIFTFVLAQVGEGSSNLAQAKWSRTRMVFTVPILVNSGYPKFLIMEL